MALTVGTDSYISVADADAYFENQLFSDAWTNATTDTKEKALKMATAKIDMQPLKGRKSVETQTLQFPRMLYSDHAGMWWADAEVPQIVKNATCEEAQAILTTQESANKRGQLQAQGVSSFKVGSASETFTGRYDNGLLSATAKRLLAPYLGGGFTVV